MWFVTFLIQVWEAFSDFQKLQLSALETVKNICLKSLNICKKTFVPNMSILLCRKIADLRFLKSIFVVAGIFGAYYAVACYGDMTPP